MTLRILLCALVLALLPIAAPAVEITDGFKESAGILGMGVYHLIGDDFEMGGATGYGTFQVCFPCFPGEAIQIVNGASGGDAYSDVIWKGRTWYDVGDPRSPGAVSVGWSASGTVPPLTGEASTVLVMPFRFEGSFNGWDDVTQEGFSEPLFGSGLATITFSRDLDGFPAWFFQTAYYDFSPALAAVTPTPEPATWFLMGSGLVGLPLLRRRRSVPR